jgi:hypothetical protein
MEPATDADEELQVVEPQDKRCITAPQPTLLENSGQCLLAISVGVGGNKCGRPQPWVVPSSVKEGARFASLRGAAHNDHGRIPPLERVMKRLVQGCIQFAREVPTLLTAASQRGPDRLSIHADVVGIDLANAARDEQKALSGLRPNLADRQHRGGQRPHKREPPDGQPQPGHLDHGRKYSQRTEHGDPGGQDGARPP